MWPICMRAIGTKAIEEETDDALALGTGRVISDGLRGDLQGLLDSGGERFFHLRYQTPGLRSNMRGALYYVSLTVENMLLNGQEDLVNEFLEAVEEAARQAGRPDSI